MDWRSYKKNLLPDIPNFHQIDVYEEKGQGYQALRKVLTSTDMGPKDVVNEVKKANIRGRGGAGFNAGLKWSFMPPKQEGLPRYLACNGDESEPGTIKDRRLFEYNPHTIIEGALIACYAMEMDAAYIYIRGEYGDWINMMQKAVDDAYAKGYAGKNIMGTDTSIDVFVHRGAGAYICGEETSLMESLEGKRPYPRSKPPFPAQVGLWGKPTTINNVETLGHVPYVIRNGAEWYSSLGAPTHPGPMLYGISGHVNRPGLYEFPSGMKLTDLIYEVAGGIRGGKKLKAVVPGGSSVPILRADMLEGLTMDADSLRTVGTFVGTAGMCVLDEDTDLVKFLLRTAKFYDHESCGQCTPCREGTGWFTKMLTRIDQGEANMRDLDTLLELCDTMEGRTVCALADAAAWPVRNTITRFRDEFEAKINKKGVYSIA
ncbi:NADH-quinone oxidoreductase subunit NuoF [Pontibacter sp. G13]|uniref:NADH-quinone oxidoreductase subunit NuoF n=1 Tax=Pontibacter sp. G13 TaxID=3074898 RepID=UPI002889BC1C|nr:NADH-quinone oxidoreductase subunit NuoF [Pontibacter sp. G13]WNJ21421.1 NADH-quinone oxidoreductase subunit NuoF [Pontibacter sp. G13]